MEFIICLFRFIIPGTRTHFPGVRFSALGRNVPGRPARFGRVGTQIFSAIYKHVHVLLGQVSDKNEGLFLRRSNGDRFIT